MAAGIEERHRKGKRPCRSLMGGRCNCEPTYRASVWSPRERKLIRRTFRNRDEARTWHEDAVVAVRVGQLRSPSALTVDEAAKAWLAGAREGSVRNRSGDRYKPSTLRGYRESLKLRVLPAIGPRRLSEVARADVQDLVDQLLAKGCGSSTVRNTLDPLRAIYRRALARDQVAINPTVGLELPASRGRRDRIASPDEAVLLLAALSDRDRPLWATAMYSGLRRGELRGLRWSDIDVAAGVIRVRRSWDQYEGEIDVKTRAGRRTVPIASELRRELAAHKLRTGGDPDALVFGTLPTASFDPSRTRGRALTAWKRAGLEPITLHECRHTFASLMIAAGVNAKALSTYMGHASVTITYDRYGHLMPGNEDEAASQLDAYLTRAVGKRRENDAPLEAVDSGP